MSSRSRAASLPITPWPEPDEPALEAPPFRPIRSFFTVVLLPWLGFWAEREVGIMGEIWIDAFATPGSGAVVASALAGGTALWFLAVAGCTRALRAQAIGAGYFFGASFCFSLLYLPVVPVLLIAILLGVGILGMAPYWALIGSVGLSRRLGFEWEQRVGPGFGRHFLSGAALFPALLVLHDAAKIRQGELLRDEYADTTPEALARFRSSDSQAEHRKLCEEGLVAYRDVVFPWELLGYERSFPGEAFQTSYYLAHGERHDARPDPDPGRSSWSREARRRQREAEDPHVWTPPSETLELERSVVEVRVDPRIAIASVDWQLRVRNHEPRSREARLQLTVPPGSVAADLGMMVGGADRDSAFGHDHDVRRAYRRTVTRRDDPAILRRDGDARDALQMFPVAAHATGEVRVQYTCPLSLLADRGHLVLPGFARLGLHLPDDLQHEVHVEVLEADGDGAQRRSLQLSNAQFRQVEGRSLDFALPELRPVWSADADGVCVQRWSSKAPPLRQAKVVVVDGSRSTAPFAAALGEQLASVLQDDDLVVHVGDVCSEWTAEDGDFLEWWSRRRFIGGVDPVLGLCRARRLSSPSQPILWLHGTQTLEPHRASRHGRTRPRPDGPLLCTELVSGVNVVADRLITEGRARRLVRAAPLELDLPRLFRAVDDPELTVQQRPRWIDAELGTTVVRHLDRVERPPSSLPPVGGFALGQLWAAREVSRLAEWGFAMPAATLATRFRIVSERSAAVVLDTPEQYAAHGLDPDAPCALDRDDSAIETPGRS